MLDAKHVLDKNSKRIKPDLLNNISVFQMENGKIKEALETLEKCR